MSTQRLTLKMEFPPADVGVTAHRFTLTSRLTGSLEGVAVACLDARYLSVHWAGAPRITRRHVMPAQWKQIATLGDILSPGSIDSDNLLATLITGDRGRAVTVTFTGVEAMKVPIEQVAQALDGLFDRKDRETSSDSEPDTGDGGTGGC